MSIKEGDRLGLATVGPLISTSVHGVVHQGFHRLTGKMVAVKLLTGPGREAFLDRSRRVTSVIDRHVARVLEAGALDAQWAYRTSEWVDGRSLAQVIGDEGTLPPPRAAHLALQICEGLNTLHNCGLIHGNLRPEHVRVAEGRLGARVVLIGDGPRQPGQPVDMETARWISPEAAAERPQDARSDVYQVGLLLFAMLAGRPPFSGQDPTALLQLHMRAPLPDLMTLRPALPTAYSELLGQCLGKSPNIRFPRIESLLRQLRPLSRTQAAQRSLSVTQLHPLESGELQMPSLSPPPPDKVEAMAALEDPLLAQDPLANIDESDLVPQQPSPIDLRTSFGGATEAAPAPSSRATGLKLNLPEGDLFEDPFRQEEHEPPPPALEPEPEPSITIAPPPAPLLLGDQIGALMRRYLSRQTPEGDPARPDALRQTPRPTSVLDVEALDAYISSLAHLLDVHWPSGDPPDDLRVLRDAIEQLVQAHGRATEAWDQAWQRARALQDELSSQEARLQGAMEALEGDVARAEERLTHHEADIRALSETLAGLESSFIDRFGQWPAGEARAPQAHFDVTCMAELDEAYRDRGRTAEKLARMMEEAVRIRRQRADMHLQRAELERSVAILSARRWSEVVEARLAAWEQARRAQAIGAALEHRCMRLGLGIARHLQNS